MKEFSAIAKSMPFRVFVSALLAFGALGLFWISHEKLPLSRSESSPELTPALASAIDREVEEVLRQFRIEKQWIRKSVVALPNSLLSRIERNVAIPRDVLPVQVNVAMNSMAKRFNGKAIAYENVKENSVTIHIEINGYIIQKISLKPNNNLQRRERKNVLPKT